MGLGDSTLSEWAFMAGRDQPDACWLLHPRDVWVQNPCFAGTPCPHPEDEDAWAEIDAEYYESEAYDVVLGSERAD